VKSPPIRPVRAAKLIDAAEIVGALGTTVPTIAIRHLEVRIGALSGPPRPGERTDLSLAKDGLTRNERHDFRKMAAHPEVVDGARTLVASTS
jgi:hypothetical protein